MQAIGETLREARIRQKVDIAEVETATKIRAKYLRALENEEFHILPGSTFVRSFLRTYAEYLGLDPQLLVEEYRAQHEPPSEAEMQHFAPSSGGRGPQRGPGGFRPGPGLVTAAVVVGLLALLLVVGLVGGDEDDGGGGERAERSAEGREREQRSDSRGDGDEARERPRRVTLRISPAEATYLCVESGEGRQLFDGVLGAPRTFRATRLRINLGRTSASVRANGRRVPIEQSSGGAGFEFTPRGREALSVGERPTCS